MLSPRPKEQPEQEVKKTLEAKQSSEQVEQQLIKKEVDNRWRITQWLWGEKPTGTAVPTVSVDPTAAVTTPAKTSPTASSNNVINTLTVQIPAAVAPPQSPKNSPVASELSPAAPVPVTTPRVSQLTAIGGSPSQKSTNTNTTTVRSARAFTTQPQLRQLIFPLR